MWTGRVSRDVTPPCAYIFDQQPGLVPFMYNGSARPFGYKGNLTGVCAGSKQDCVMASQDRPQQASGLESMWTQSLGTGFVSFSWEGCSAEQMPVAYTQYPGMSDSKLDSAVAVQGGSPGSMVWVCNRVVDPDGKSCRFSFNYDLCSFMSDDECAELMQFPIDASLLSYFNDTLQELMSKNSSAAHVEAGLQPLLDAYPLLANFTDLVGRVTTKTNRSFQEVMDVLDVGVPSFTDELLAKACAAPVAMLMIDAAPLQVAASIMNQLVDSGLPYFGSTVKLNNGSAMHLPKYGECDHAVYLETCDTHNNNYTIWSWGTTYSLTKEILLGNRIEINLPSRTNTTFNTGMACGAVVADSITA
jgi:hypothetical protein